jgi:putative PIN family toxin of toxin-antitoxin system
MRVVFDANVIAAAVCWNGESYLCLVKVARRQAFAFGTTETTTEANAVSTELLRARRPTHGALQRLNWYLEKVKIVEAVSIGKRRSGDPKDDVYLSAALACDAHCIVTYDRDLLVLGKPFGVPILTPAQFIKSLKA